MNQLLGVYTALVVDNEDPQNMGRIKIEIPLPDNLSKEAIVSWARLSTMMAGENRGTWFIPEVGDEVLIAFHAGDPRHPYVVGALWNEKQKPPLTNKNDMKIIKTRSGLSLEFNDQASEEKISITTPAGQHIVLDDGMETVSIKDGNNNTITLNKDGIKIESSAKLELNASTVDVSAGMVTVNSEMTKFSGTIQTDTLVANSVVSASYSPGAGNIW